MSPDNDGWNEYRRLVLKQQEDTVTHLEDLTKEVVRIDNDVTAIKTRLSMVKIGSISGGSGAAGALIIKMFEWLLQTHPKLGPALITNFWLFFFH